MGYFARFILKYFVAINPTEDNLLGISVNFEASVFLNVPFEVFLNPSVSPILIEFNNLCV